MSRIPSTRRGPVAAYGGVLRLSEKLCRKCETTKPIADFRISKYTTLSGKQSLRVSTHCRECNRINKRGYHWKNRAKFVAKAKAWAAANPEIWNARNRRIQLKKRLKKFGLTLQDYDRLVTEQDGKCAVCKQPPPRHQCRKYDYLPDLLSIDHDHQTNRVRGLLCRRCNLALGNISESPETAAGLLEYIHSKC